MSEYIEREALLDRVCAVKDKLQLDLDNLFEDGVRIGFENVEMEIENIPAADVRPVVKAHWYWDKDGMDCGIGAWRCSACGARSPMWWNTDRGSPMHKSGHYFCPNCGADMRE